MRTKVLLVAFVTLALIQVSISDGTKSDDSKRCNHVLGACLYLSPAELGQKEHDENDTSIIRFTQLTPESDKDLADTLKRLIEFTTQNAIRAYIINQIDTIEQTHLARCKQGVEKVPEPLRETFMNCGFKNMEESMNQIKDLIDGLADKKRLTKVFTDKLNECQKKKNEYHEKEEEKSDRTNISTDSPPVSRQKRARTRVTTSTTPKPKINIGEFIKKAARFAQAMRLQWETRGCFGSRTAEVALNGKMILFDLATNIYENYDLSRFLEQKSAMCIKQALDSYMVKHCVDSYIPVERDDKRR